MEHEERPCSRGDELLADELRYRKGIYTLLARVFCREMDDAAWKAVSSLANELSSAAVPPVSDSSPATAGEELPESSIARGCALVASDLARPGLDRREIAADYVNVFLGFGSTLRGAYPYESWYRTANRTLMAEPRAEMARILKREGLSPVDVDLSPEDHISTELSLLAYYADAALCALETGDESALAQHRARYREFCRAHPAQWVGCWCAEALSLARTDFYRGFVLIAQGMMALDTP